MRRLCLRSDASSRQVGGGSGARPLVPPSPCSRCCHSSRFCRKGAEKLPRREVGGSPPPEPPLRTGVREIGSMRPPPCPPLFCHLLPPSCCPPVVAAQAGARASSQAYSGPPVCTCTRCGSGRCPRGGGGWRGAGCRLRARPRTRRPCRAASSSWVRKRGRRQQAARPRDARTRRRRDERSAARRQTRAPRPRPTRLCPHTAAERTCAAPCGCPAAASRQSAPPSSHPRRAAAGP
mmetsp:Transcript_43419/g.107327  ORF Transcript_43419/g.107327 Transcript_43419/m.107327 type:complete len:235 (+) Transcript_43419:3530-4234(+)